MRVFLFLFLLFPLLELAVLIQVGSAIGVLPTLLLVIATAILGSVLLRVAGVATAWRARERLARGELPEEEMLEGLLIAVGGGLLLLPGFISDVFGLLCLLPFTRRLLIRDLRRRAEAQALRQRAFADDLAARPGQTRPNVIEGEFERRDH
ncbi:MAG: FxsA family protein [Pseudomonas sp.]